MKESYVEGLAVHNGPKSCAAVRKGVGEVLTGVRAGRVLSRERNLLRGADAVGGSGRPHPTRRLSPDAPEPRAVRDPAHARKHLAREPGCPALVRPRQRGRPHREVFGRTPMMYERGKSDGPIVPAKPSNNGQGARRDLCRATPAPAESAEERGPAKGNRRESRTPRTQCRKYGRTKFSRRYVGRHVMLVMSCIALRHHPRQEPDAVIPLVRICAGGGPKGPSLPRLLTGELVSVLLILYQRGAVEERGWVR